MGLCGCFEIFLCFFWLVQLFFISLQRIWFFTVHNSCRIFELKMLALSNARVGAKTGMQ